MIESGCWLRKARVLLTLGIVLATAGFVAAESSAWSPLPESRFVITVGQFQYNHKCCQRPVYVECNDPTLNPCVTNPNCKLTFPPKQGICMPSNNAGCIDADPTSHCTNPVRQTDFYPNECKYTGKINTTNCPPGTARCDFHPPMKSKTPIKLTNACNAGESLCNQGTAKACDGP